MKRFTDTNKWRDVWFMELPPKLKVVWMYLVDNCDHAGILEVNIKLICFSVGKPVEKDEIMTAMQGRVVEFKPGKWFIKPFIKFQYGIELNPENSAHQGVIKRLSEFGLDCPVPIKTKGATKGLPSPYDRAKDKDKDKDKDQYQKDRGAGKGLRIPDKLCLNEEFITVWNEWMEFRRLKKGCVDFNRLFQKQLDWLGNLTVPDAIESLNKSMRNGWTGLFDQNVQGNGHSSGNGKLAPIDKAILQKEKDLICARLTTLRSQYDGHQSWSEKDKSEAHKLKPRLAEINSQLGCLL